MLELYQLTYAEDQYHNENISSLSIGELQEYSLSPINIPSFEQFIFKKLTEHGYSKGRYDQIIINSRAIFEEMDKLDPRLGKFQNDLSFICSAAETISKETLNKPNHRAVAAA
jgi:dynactin complex subunit